jgi:hypothetical protein
MQRRSHPAKRRASTPPVPRVVRPHVPVRPMKPKLPPQHRGR